MQQWHKRLMNYCWETAKHSNEQDGVTDGNKNKEGHSHIIFSALGLHMLSSLEQWMGFMPPSQFANYITGLSRSYGLGSQKMCLVYNLGFIT